jgi:hemoglobin-like flavoprotein
MGQSGRSWCARDRFRVVFSPVTVKEISAMTNQEIQLVQRSFELITPVLESATTTFYNRLFELDPSLRHMFRSPQEEQARKLAHVLTVVVKGLSKLEQILPAVQQLGRRHSSYGVRPEHYSTVGAALLWTLQSGLGEAFTSEVRDAWVSAYALLSSTMQRAAEEETIAMGAALQPA